MEDVLHCNPAILNRHPVELYPWRPSLTPEKQTNVLGLKKR